MPKREKDPAGIAGGGDACVFCQSEEDNEEAYGKLLKKSGVTSHYFCMLFSSGLWQRGKNDTYGILGFMPADIRREQKRGARLSCQYCKKKGATIGCVVSNCRKTFHFRCGRDAGGLSQFFDEFRSYCPDHRPHQGAHASVSDRLAFYGTAKSTCSICMTAVEARASNGTLRSPCCRHAWFHRDCMQRYASSAGLFFFKCPLCNNKDIFQAEMLQFGIYIPEQDAAWEQEPNAFHELLERYDRCDAENCLCPKGRKHDGPAGSRWELILCDTCGSSGSHNACEGLNNVKNEFQCDSCMEINSSLTTTLKRRKKTNSSSGVPDQEELKQRLDQHRMAAEREQRAVRRRHTSSPEIELSSLNSAVSRLRHGRSTSTVRGLQGSHHPVGTPVVRITQANSEMDIDVEDSDADVAEIVVKSEEHSFAEEKASTSQMHHRKSSLRWNVKDVVNNAEKRVLMLSSLQAADSDASTDGDKTDLRTTRSGKVISRSIAQEDNSKMNNNNLGYSDGSDHSDACTEKKYGASEPAQTNSQQENRMRGRPRKPADDCKEGVDSRVDVESKRPRGRPRKTIDLKNSLSKHSPTSVAGALCKRSAAKMDSVDEVTFTPEASSDDSSDRSSVSSSPRRQLPCFGKATWKHRRLTRFSPHSGGEKRRRYSSDDSLDANLMDIASQISRYSSMNQTNEGASTSQKSDPPSWKKRQGALRSAESDIVESGHSTCPTAVNNLTSADSSKTVHKKLAVDFTDRAYDESSPSVKISVPGMEISIKSHGKTNQHISPTTSPQPSHSSVTLPHKPEKHGKCEVKSSRSPFNPLDHAGTGAVNSTGSSLCKGTDIAVGMEHALLTDFPDDDDTLSDLETFSLRLENSPVASPITQGQADLQMQSSIQHSSFQSSLKPSVSQPSPKISQASLHPCIFQSSLQPAVSLQQVAASSHMSVAQPVQLLQGADNPWSFTGQVLIISHGQLQSHLQALSEVPYQVVPTVPTSYPSQIPAVSLSSITSQTVSVTASQRAQIYTPGADSVHNPDPLQQAVVAMSVPPHHTAPDLTVVTSSVSAPIPSILKATQQNVVPPPSILSVAQQGTAFTPQAVTTLPVPQQMSCVLKSNEPFVQGMISTTEVVQPQQSRAFQMSQEAWQPQTAQASQQPETLQQSQNLLPAGDQSSLSMSRGKVWLSNLPEPLEPVSSYTRDQSEVFVLLSDSSDDDIQIDEDKSSAPRKRRANPQCRHRTQGQQHPIPTAVQSTVRVAPSGQMQQVSMTSSFNQPAPVGGFRPNVHSKRIVEMGPTYVNDGDVIMISPQAEPQFQSQTQAQAGHHPGQSRSLMHHQSHLHHSCNRSSPLHAQPSSQMQQASAASVNQSAAIMQPTPVALFGPNPCRGIDRGAHLTNADDGDVIIIDPQSEPQSQPSTPSLTQSAPEASPQTPIVFKSLSQALQHMKGQWQASQPKTVAPPQKGPIDLTEDVREHTAMRHEEHSSDSDLEILG